MTQPMVSLVGDVVLPTDVDWKGMSDADCATEAREGSKEAKAELKRRRDAVPDDSEGTPA